MKVNKSLIEKFLLNRCSEEEAEAVYKFLQENPEKLDRFLHKELWDNHAVIDSTEKKKVYVKVKERLGFKRSIKIGLWVSRFAATVLLISFIAYWFIREPPKEPIVENAYTQVYINFGNDDMILPVKDGSEITLKPKSEIRFLESLEKDRRNFYLKGEAMFKVAKDSLRPFNVFTYGIKTTALGTEFTVSAFESMDDVKIFLHSGSVVIQPTGSVLKPGEQLSVNRTSLIAQLTPVGKTKLRTKEVQKSIPEVNTNERVIVFKNEPLENIFRKLESEFLITISFDKDVVNDMYFTGSFKRSKEMVMPILEEIANLNYLQLIKKENNHYEVIYQGIKQ